MAMDKQSLQSVIDNPMSTESQIAEARALLNTSTEDHKASDKLLGEMQLAYRAKLKAYIAGEPSEPSTLWASVEEARWKVCK